jgi:hypothetical protein
MSISHVLIVDASVAGKFTPGDSYTIEYYDPVGGLTLNNMVPYYRRRLQYGGVMIFLRQDTTPVIPKPAVNRVAFRRQL